MNQPWDQPVHRADLQAEDIDEVTGVLRVRAAHGPSVLQSGAAFDAGEVRASKSDIGFSFF